MKTSFFRQGFLGFTLLCVASVMGCEGCDEDLVEVQSRMTLDPLEVELNPVPVAADTLILFEVGNPSSVAINIEEITLSADSDPAFEIVARPDAVSPRSTETIQVKVRPMFPTTIGAKLQVKSNADTDPELEAQIKVTSLDMGLPDIEVDPTSVVFAEVASFDVARAQVTVTNVGARDLLLDSIDITWSQSSIPPPTVETGDAGPTNNIGLDGGGTTSTGDAGASVATSSSGSVGADGGSATESGTTGAQNNNTDAGTAVVGIQENPPFRLRSLQFPGLATSCRSKPYTRSCLFSGGRGSLFGRASHSDQRS